MQVLHCTCDIGVNLLCVYRGRIQRKTWCMGSDTGADYNLTTSPYVHSRVDSNTCTMGNPTPLKKGSRVSRPHPGCHYQTLPGRE